jgi:hypothetical protein
MPRPRRTPDVAGRIQTLLQEKQQHEEALVTINQTLEQIGSLLGGGRRGRPGRPAASASFALPGPVMGGGTATGGRRRRKRRRFDMTGEDSIIQFVRQNRSPTTAQIIAHWRKEGRGGKADNALSRLVKIRRLKRQPIPGERGSRYLIP